MASKPRHWILCASDDFSAAELAKALQSERYEAKAEGKSNVLITYKKKYELEVVFETDVDEIKDELAPKIKKHEDARKIAAAKRLLVLYWSAKDWEEVFEACSTIDGKIAKRFGGAWAYDPNAMDWVVMF